MTKGWIVLKEKIKGNTGHIFHSVYSNSDSYISGLGEILFTHLKNGTLKDYILMQEADSEDKNDARYPYLECMRKLNASRKVSELRENEIWRFVDYGYIFNEAKYSLAVYNWNKRLFTVDQTNVDKWLFVAAHEDELWKILTYNSEKLSFKSKHDYKALQEMSLEELSDLLKNAKHEYITLDTNHNWDVWNDRDHITSYKWYLQFQSFDDKTHRLTFNPMKRLDAGSDQYWEIYLQLPYVRIPVNLNVRTKSEKTLTRTLTEFIKENSHQLFRLALILERVNAFMHDPIYKDYMSSNGEADPSEIQRLASDLRQFLEEEWEKDPWLSFGGYCSPDTLIREAYTFPLQCRQYRNRKSG